MLGALSKTGILPFTRSAHLEGNKSDVQIGNAIHRAELMEDNEKRREDLNKSVARRLDMDLGEDPSTAVEPIRLRRIDKISTLFGPHNDPETVRLAKQFGLNMWPKYDVTRTKPPIWALCLEKSPSLLSQFSVADQDELKKYHNVGLLLEEEMDKLTPSQALILG